MTRVVLVEDDDDIRTLLDVTFSMTDEFDATVITQGVAVRWSREWKDVDVLVTDWMMPDFGGTDVIAVARRYHPSLPCLVLTARAGDRSSFTDLPDDVTLCPKPLGVDELFEAIRNAR